MTAKLTDPVAAERIARLVAPALGRLNAKKTATSTKVAAQEVTSGSSTTPTP